MIMSTCHGHYVSGDSGYPETWTATAANPAKDYQPPGYGPRTLPLRTADTGKFVPAPPQQRPATPLNFQPQTFPRPPPNNSFRYNLNQPPTSVQSQRKEESSYPNPDFQITSVNQTEKHSNSHPREQQTPSHSQAPPVPRLNPQGFVRRPNPWDLLKQKLPADVRQQFIPIRRPPFEGRMQAPDQSGIQRQSGDGQITNITRVGSPHPGMQSPPQGMQSPNPGGQNTLQGFQSPTINPTNISRPPSGNQQQKMGIPMQRPLSQEGRESPSTHPAQNLQRAMSGERRSPYELQRNDSLRSIDNRGQTGMFSPPRLTGDTPPGLSRPPSNSTKPGDDDNDVVYSLGGDPRLGMGRGQSPPLRPPSTPRPGSIPSDMNRETPSPRPLMRSESRQSFDMRSPPGPDNRMDPKFITRESPLSRPMSSDHIKQPMSSRTETPPNVSATSSPKPDSQITRQLSSSSQDSMDRQRVFTPQNSSESPNPSPDLRPNSRADDSKITSGKLTPAGGRDSQNLSPNPSTEMVEQNMVSSTENGVLSPVLRPNDPLRTETPSSVGSKDYQLSEPSPKVSQNNSPTPTKLDNDSGTETPIHEKEITVSVTNEDNYPVKTPEKSSTPIIGAREIERPKSLCSSPLISKSGANSPDIDGRKTPVVRISSRASSAGKGNDEKSPLQRNQSAKRPQTPKTPDGDHDSGVDESTQRKDGPATNGDLGSPSKSPSKIPAPKRLSMPSPTKSTKGSPKTPEAPATAEKKKVPMNKIQVGAAPSPNLKTVKSKIGSLQNSTHKPGGGNVKIENRKLDWKAQPRIAAKNETYQPGGGDKKITQVKLQWNAKPKVGSLDNATHKPGGGEKKIESVKLDFKEKAKPKVGSKDNIKHTPGGGNIKIEEQKIELNVQSKVGSLDNVKHTPGGGEKKIFDDKEYLKQMSSTASKAGSEGIPSGTQSPMHMSQSQVSVTDAC